ncbi:G patch domain-containing protein 3-like [Dreissena polymorpha]|uniref:G patch domain-containing protein 3-like n=1 Tax=Dreissena polymorpha TaxID=45954 RepID=UPI0022645718|nr:G patch domain-containing protein 3-like [Dreissena polymorpha]
MESDNTETNVLYAIINNIPPEYHSKDLRNYFSQFTESKGFDCFHFRNRPESVSSLDPKKSELLPPSGKRSKCCVVKVHKHKFGEFLKMYNKKHWIGIDGEIMTQICYIFKIKMPANSEKSKMVTRGERKQVPSDRELFTEQDLKVLPEMNPPDIMPNGNVGTPTLVFLDFIKQCRLPPKVISKLGLTFPKTRTNKQYGSVPFDYGNDVVEGSHEAECEVLTASGHKLVTENVNQKSGISESDSASIKPRKKSKKSWRDDEARRRMDLNIEEKMIGKQDGSEKDNDSCEEWERHEALYDDVSNQERNTERLFEEEIELKWEKGGSGLVFYTDAQYWQAQDGDFDEQTADDWDVDMSAYYEEGAGDKDARDFLKLRQDKRRRDGIEATDRFTAGIAIKKKNKGKNTEGKPATIGNFEAHTKGVGRRILETQGWTDGEGLGSTIRGRAEALDSEGQNPRDRKGLGYHGEKLNRNPGRAQRKVVISTIFDNPLETDPNEPLKRRHEPYHLKYRDEVKFRKSEEILNQTDL